MRVLKPQLSDTASATLIVHGQVPREHAAGEPLAASVFYPSKHFKYQLGVLGVR